jgi:trans-aconitate methyltransferase
MAYASVDRFAGWFRTTRMPWIDSVLPAQRAEFIDAFIARYLERHPTDSDGRVHVAMVRLEVEATT